ncbi:hypothetical protein BSL78_28163, partial [Apostichopus japonicus]
LRNLADVPSKNVCFFPIGSLTSPGSASDTHRLRRYLDSCHVARMELIQWGPRRGSDSILQLYLQKGNGEWALEVTVPHSEHVTEHMQNVTDLMGGSTYSIAVTVIREGEGGEGERSSPITVTTVTIGTTPLLPDETSTADTTVFGNNTPAPATSTNVGAIVFSVLCLVLVILSGILLVIFWRNRR